MRRLLLIVTALFLLVVIAETGFTQTQSDNALKQLRIRIGAGGNPDIWVINKSWSNSALDRDLFHYPRTGVFLYTKNGDGSLRSSIFAALDQTWNRMVYYSVPQDWIKGFSSFGKGDCQVRWPRAMAAHVISPDFYDVFIADTENNRVLCAGFVHYAPPHEDTMLCYGSHLTGNGLWRPIDVAIYNGGTYYDYRDDRVWVLNDNNKLKRFSVNTSVLECTIELPTDLKATAIARDTDGSDTAGVWVAMCGDGTNEIWRYRPVSGGWARDLTATKTCASPIVDMHFDAYDHLWALNDSSAVFTKYHEFDSYPLCTFGSSGTGTNQFLKPCAFTITAGPYRSGSVVITEDWSDSTGLLHYGIATDVTDVNVDANGQNTIHELSFMLVDPSHVTVAIYDSNEVLVDYCCGPDEGQNVAGYTSKIWDGTDAAGQQTPAGNYSYAITAKSYYSLVILGKDRDPVNVVTRTGTFYHAEGCCLGVLGNVDESADGLVTMSDLNVLTDHLFISLAPLSCPEAGDIDSDGIVSMGDLIVMIDHLYISLNPLPPCP